MRLFVFVQFSFENPGPELQQQAAESPGVSLSGFHVLVGLRKSIAVQVFAQKKKTKKNVQAVVTFDPVCVCLLYIQYTHTLFPLTEVALQRPGVGWKERKKKKRKRLRAGNLC